LDHLSAGRRSTTTDAYRTIPPTSYAGEQSQPAFSPDGRRVAFVWTGEDGESRKIYIKQPGSETLLKLTNLAESEFNPVWSPDGTQIAFLALSSEAGDGIYLISSMGGVPRKIFTPHSYVHWEQGVLSWSPDGKSLLFPDTADSQVVSSIYQLPLDTLQPHAITHPPAEWEGDMSPVFSRQEEDRLYSRNGGSGAGYLLDAGIRWRSHTVNA
jgi:Tol biopolymer transport system component